MTDNSNSELIQAELMEEEPIIADPVKPDEPSLPPREWMQKNLFYSPFSTVLTILFAFIGFMAFRTLLNYVFGEERLWIGIRANARLMMVQSYPVENMNRMWLATCIIAAMMGITAGLVKKGAGFSYKKISIWLLSWGSLILLGTLITKPAALREGLIRSDDGGIIHQAVDTVVRDAEQEPIRQSFGEAMVDRWGWWLLGLILFGAGVYLRKRYSDLELRTKFVPAVPFSLAVLGAIVSTLWWYSWGHVALNESNQWVEYPESTVAMSTKFPVTIVFASLVAAYMFARWTVKRGMRSRMQTIMVFVWLLAPFILFWQVLRNPVIDWNHVMTTDIPLVIAFAVGGAAIMWVLTNPKIGELGRVIAAALLLFAFLHWVAAFFGWYSMLQKVRISFLVLALFALLAPSFAGEKKQRMTLVWAWVAFIVFLHYIITIINTASGLTTPSPEFIGGYATTIMVAWFVTIFSFPLGVLMALARTSRLPLFRIMATTFIEAFRGVPMITILFFFKVFINVFLPEGMALANFAGVGIGLTLFSSAYLAENVRGGLQAVRRGQYEASDALGLTTVQRTSFIVLPQALRTSIPPLVSQMISTYKETSLLAIISIFDLLFVAHKLIPAQTGFRGVNLEGLLIAALIYFIGAYGMSRYSQRLERQLGVGER